MFVPGALLRRGLRVACRRCPWQEAGGPAAPVGSQPGTRSMSTPTDIVQPRRQTFILRKMRWLQERKCIAICHFADQAIPGGRIAEAQLQAKLRIKSMRLKDTIMRKFWGDPGAALMQGPTVMLYSVDDLPLEEFFPQLAQYMDKHKNALWLMGLQVEGRVFAASQALLMQQYPTPAYVAAGLQGALQYPGFMLSTLLGIKTGKERGGEAALADADACRAAKAAAAVAPGAENANGGGGAASMPAAAVAAETGEKEG